MRKIKLEHDAVDPQQTFKTFVSVYVRNTRAHTSMFEKQQRKQQKLPGDLSSDDESVIGDQTIHFEYSMDADGNPIEFDGEDVMGNNKTAKSKEKRNRNTGLSPLSLESYIILHPDDGDEHKLYIVQVLALNPEPENPETWVQNNNRKWHYKAGWWELVNPNVAGPIRKVLRSKGICDVLAAGKEDDFDLQNDNVVQRLSKGPKQWMIQFMDRESWLSKTLAENVDMNGKRVKDRALKKNLVKMLHEQCPHLKLLSDEPRLEQQPAGVFASSSADQNSKKRKADSPLFRQGKSKRTSEDDQDAEIEQDFGINRQHHSVHSSPEPAAHSADSRQLVVASSAGPRSIVTAARLSKQSNRHLSAAFARATGSKAVQQESESSDEEEERELDRHREPSITVERYIMQNLQDFEDANASHMHCESASAGGAAAAGGGGTGTANRRKKFSSSQCTILAIGR